MPSSRIRRRLTFGVALLVFTLTAAGSALASDVANKKKFGIGGILGQPTGATFKYYPHPMHGLTAAVGFGWLDGANFHTHLDYAFHIMLTKPQHFDLALYFGVGAKFVYWWHRDGGTWWYGDRTDRHHAGFGLRLPVGVEFNLNKIPLGVFGELAAGLGLFPDIGFFVDGAVGARYYF